MRDWNFLNKHRVRSGPFASDDSFGFNGAFRFNLCGENRAVCCIVSDAMGWQHVSVSFGKVPGTPSWAVMCEVKDLFWEDEEEVIQFHPKKSEYVNMHQGCLHLWRCTDGRLFPTPDKSMVGF